MSNAKILFLPRDGCVYEIEGEEDPDHDGYVCFPDIHFDDLFESEVEANNEAISYCKKMIDEYQKKLAKLEAKFPPEEWVDSHV